MSVRITTSMISGNYGSNLRSLQNTLNKKLTQAYTYRSFDKASDNPLLASQAYEVQWELDQNGYYQNNVSNVTSMAKTADSTLSTVEEILSKAGSTEVIQGITGTMSTSDRSKIADQLESMRDAIIADMNTQFNEQYLFSGCGTSTPFSTDKDGNLLYRGVNVDTGDPDQLKKLAGEATYVDVGIGMTYDASGKIIAQSAYNSSVPGITVLGYGETDDGVPKNLCSILTQLSNTLKDSSLSGDDFSNKINALRDSFSDSYDNFRTEQAKVGTNINFLDDTDSYLDNMNLNLLDKDNEVEYTDPASAILDFTQTQYSYNAALQVGTKILQKTLMDYLSY